MTREADKFIPAVMEQARKYDALLTRLDNLSKDRLERERKAKR